MKDNDEDDLGRCIDKVGTQIRKECKAIVHDKSSKNTPIDKHLANEDVSSTLQALLSAISEKFDQSLQALLIGNIITSIVIVDGPPVLTGCAYVRSNKSTF